MMCQYCQSPSYIHSCVTNLVSISSVLHLHVLNVLNVKLFTAGCFHIFSMLGFYYSISNLSLSLLAASPQQHLLWWHKCNKTFEKIKGFLLKYFVWICFIDTSSLSGHILHIRSLGTPTCFKHRQVI